MKPRIHLALAALGLLSSAAFSLECSAAVPPLSNRTAFNDPKDAVSSLEQALGEKSEAEAKHALLAIFGPESKDMLSSGDPVDDKLALESFKEALQERVEVATSHIVGPAKQEVPVAVLIVGQQKWPFPIALIKSDAGWQFDTEVGRQEIIDRRIGENELKVLSLFPEYVAAQHEYSALPQNKDHAFATKFLSSPGAQDGLYWPAQKGQPLSPIGPLVANAADAGYEAHADGSATPFFGYYFRILTSQGKNARGGAMNYIVNGKMTQGFALLAYPAKWDRSGAMSFLVGPDGVIYQKNLGAKTAEIAAKMTSFDPDPSWNPA
ncbi:MAG: DUF2950 domain-containing protein [Deltaproteobacteria bacterium]|nr:DUF2950 domain-containing protein [Deltaproteobacteria bacterium]